MEQPQTVTFPPAGNLSLFALGSSREFGKSIACHLGISLSTLEEREFEDGEHKTRPLSSVRGHDVYVIQSQYSEHHQSANDKLCRLLFFIGALKDAGAARITAVIPYLAYARKDRRTKSHDPVTTKYVAALLEAVGTDAVATMDVHNLAAFQNAFRCRTEHMEANRLFARHFVPLVKGRSVVVVSPDAGGIKRAERFRQVLSNVIEAPVGAAFAEKYRSEGVVSGNMVVGDIKGKDAIIFDDLISTGNTIMRTAQACCTMGANRVHAVATHGLFMPGANTIMADPSLDSIVITDTVMPFRLESGALQQKTTILSCSELFAEAIGILHSNGSMTELTGEW